MTLLETTAVAFAMFSAVPVPQPVWNEKNMRYALCAFPLVGVVCCAAPEKKQEILKDPHCGAFAVIRLCTYFTAYLGLCAAVDCTPRAALCMGLGFVLERALSGYAIAAFPLAKNTGLAHTFATGADRTAVRRALLVLCALAAAGMAAAGGMTGAAMALAAVLVFLRYRAAQKQFGGISGDLAGWFLQKAELWMLAALAACSLLSGVTG